MTTKRKPKRATRYTIDARALIPMQKYVIEIFMSDGSKGRHEAPYADAFAALRVAKLSFPEASRITVQKADHA